MIIQYLGHSGFYIQCAGTSIVVDPFFLDSTVKAIPDFEKLPCDLLLLTHGHQDHIKDATTFLKQDTCQMIANYEIVTWFEQQFPNARYHAMNIGGKYVTQGFSIKMVAALHSSTLPDGSSGGLACGFIIEDQENAVYIAGDTALSTEMQLIPAFVQARLTAILPLGGCFTMDVEDAIKAAAMTGTQTVIGCHYNTFPPINIDINQSKTKFEQAGLSLVLLEVGEQIEI